MEPGFWDQLAAAPPEERTLEDLPVNQWFIGSTATEENGGAAPTIRRVGVENHPQFNIGVRVIGGPTQLAKQAGMFSFFQAFVRPGENDKTIGGKLAAFLNSAFVNGSPLETSHLRWGSTLNELRKAAEAGSLTPEMYENDSALFLAGAAVLALRDNSRKILFKTTQRSYTPKGSAEKVKGRIEVGAIEDYTEVNVRKRGVVLFGAEAPKF